MRNRNKCLPYSKHNATGGKNPEADPAMAGEIVFTLVLSRQFRSDVDHARLAGTRLNRQRRATKATGALDLLM
jgi:hypothetical protein